MTEEQSSNTEATDDAATPPAWQGVPGFQAIEAEADARRPQPIPTEKEVITDEFRRHVAHYTRRSK